MAAAVAAADVAAKPVVKIQSIAHKIHSTSTAQVLHLSSNSTTINSTPSAQKWVALENLNGWTLVHCFNVQNRKRIDPFSSQPPTVQRRQPLRPRGERDRRPLLGHLPTRGPAGLRPKRFVNTQTLAVLRKCETELAGQQQHAVHHAPVSHRPSWCCRRPAGLHSGGRPWRSAARTARSARSTCPAASHAGPATARP